MARSKPKKQNARVKTPGRADVGPSIIEDEFGKYRIRAGQLSGNFVARAFPRTANSQGLMAEATGESEAEAIEKLKEVLANRDVERTASRRWEALADLAIPIEDEYVEALEQTNLSDPQVSMLREHSIAGEKGLTAVALMNAAGYRSSDTALKVLARAGGMIADFLGIDVPSSETSGRPEGARLIGFRQARDDTDTEKQDVWIMHDELRKAVRVAL